jgi:hypothetical protein
MVGARCPPSGGPFSQGHSRLTGLTINGRAINVTGAVNQRVDLPNGYVVINEQTHFGTAFHAGRTLIALHVVINGAVPGSDRNVSADIVAGRVRIHIDCP